MPRVAPVAGIGGTAGTGCQSAPGVTQGLLKRMALVDSGGFCEPFPCIPCRQPACQRGSAQICPALSVFTVLDKLQRLISLVFSLTTSPS